MRKYAVRKITDQDDARLRRWAQVGMSWVAYREYEEVSYRVFPNGRFALRWAVQDIESRRKRNASA